MAVPGVVGRAPYHREVPSMEPRRSTRPSRRCSTSSAPRPTTGPRSTPGSATSCRPSSTDGLAEIADELDPEKPLWVSKRDLCDRARLRAAPPRRGGGRLLLERRHRQGQRGPQGDRAVGALAGRTRSPRHGRRGPGPPGQRRRRPRRLAPDLRGGRPGRAAGRGQRAGRHVLRVLPAAEGQVACRSPRAVCGPSCSAAGSCSPGRTDLSLGRSIGTTAGKVIIDLKTGGHSPSHLDDLRFYALVETLRLGTPPRLLASYYLDAGRAQPEAVTEGLLRAAVARTSTEPASSTSSRSAPASHGCGRGRTCRWCPALAVAGPDAPTWARTTSTSTSPTPTDRRARPPSRWKKPTGTSRPVYASARGGRFPSMTSVHRVLPPEPVTSLDDHVRRRGGRGLDIARQVEPRRSSTRSRPPGSAVGVEPASPPT